MPSCRSKQKRRREKASLFIPEKSARNKRQPKAQTNKTRSEEHGWKQSRLQTREQTEFAASHLLTIDQTNRNAWTPSHKQIKRARKAAPPWHPELAKRAAKKRAQRFAFSPPKLTLGSYEDGDACCRKSGRFSTEDWRLWEFWKEELVRNETRMERNGWIREARERKGEGRFR